MRTQKLMTVLARGLAACLGLATVASANPTTLPGAPGYFNGVNIPWTNNHYGNDFGGGNYSASTWNSLLVDLHNYKTNFARVWLHANGWASPTFSGSDPIGLPAGTPTDLADMLDKANANGVKVQLCLWTNEMIANGKGAVISNTTYTTHYINNCLIPILNAIKAKPALYSIEVINEPEWGVTEADTHPSPSVSLAQMRAFIQTITNTVHSNAPGIKVTVGSASVKWSTDNGKDGTLADWWKGLGLDYRDVHYYSWMINLAQGYDFDPFETGHTPAYYGLENLAVLIGEMGGKGNTPYTDALTMMNRAYTNGYGGHAPWSWTTDKSDSEGSWVDFNNELLTFANNHNLSGGDTQAPTVPSGLGATAASSTQVNLSWSASTDNVGVTGYKINRNGAQIATTAGTSYSDTTVAASTTYSYTVAAYDAAGNTSANSSTASVTTPAGGGSSTLQAEAGTFGGGGQIQSASNAQGGQVIGNLNNVGAYSQVTYSASAAGNYSLVVRYANGWGANRTLSLYVNGTRIQQLTFTATADWNTFTNLGAVTVALNAGSNTIKIQRDSADNPAADIDCYTLTASAGSGVPAAPTNLAAAVASSSQINLTWTDNATNETAYTVERKTGSGGTYAAVTSTLAANTVSYSNTGLTASTTYFYRVKATNASGSSTYSNEVSATTAASGGSATAQAESGTLVGCATASSFAGYSGTGYVDAGTFDNGDTITVHLTVATAGTYTIRVRYAGLYGDKYQELFVNGVDTASVFFPATSTWANADTAGVHLNAGDNTIQIQASWGWDHIDYIQAF